MFGDKISFLSFPAVFQSQSALQCDLQKRSTRLYCSCQHPAKTAARPKSLQSSACLALQRR